jgi:ATP-dependent DNA helicase Rep
LASLNPEQQTAVRHTQSPLLVLAGAGSGKTAVITHKVAWLIQKEGLEPSQIAAVTFTNKAAREMKARLGKMLPAQTAKAVAVSTFHTLGLNILKTHVDACNRRPGFSLYGSEDAQNLVAKLVISTKKKSAITAQTVQWQISRWKNDGARSGLALIESAKNELELASARVYPEYEAALAAYNAFDLDDLIVKPVELFETHASVRKEWEKKLRYLLVDEYQDTNGAQYALVKLLGQTHGRFTVVGDDDQSIYAWRGARAENLKELARDFPNLKVIKLEQNYRSTSRILRAANFLIEKNPHLYSKKLWSNKGLGAPIRVLTTRNEEHEAERVATDLMFHKHQHKANYSDYAILYRENHQSRALEKALRERRIPYFLSGGNSFFDRTEVKDILAYLRLLANPDDDAAFLRIVNTPRREIGAATLKALSQIAGANQTSLFAAAKLDAARAELNARQFASLRVFTDWIVELSSAALEHDSMTLLRRLMSELHYDDWLRETADDPKAAERKLENLKELVEWFERLAREEANSHLNDLVAKLVLLGMLEKKEPSETRDEVSLMTLHAAKGLEFPCVYIVGFEENCLPHYQSTHGDDGIQEERRLCYVGLTRAEKYLTLSHAQERRRGGEVVSALPSRFLSELPPEDLEWDTAKEKTQEDSEARANTYLKNLKNLLQTPSTS